jgi:hypothetical protein
LFFFLSQGGMDLRGAAEGTLWGYINHSSERRREGSGQKQKMVGGGESKQPGISGEAGLSLSAAEES